MRPVLERSSSGFTVRLERPSGGVDAMTDGGVHTSLESFLPEARNWLARIGYDGDVSDLTLEPKDLR